MASAGLVGIYASEHGRLRRLARRITGSAEAAEDAVHDAFLKLSGREVRAADVGLVVRTAQNLARDAARAERVRRLHASKVTLEQVAPGAVAPDDDLAGRQELADLLAALRSLPDRTRRVFLMSKVDEMTYPEIARLLDVSVSTVEKDMISALDFCRAWRRRRG
jgi:RNA polymerase sigma factor (sigma-70 family)